ncbi:MAG: hypothetical protein F9K23_07785 [Bacteroidetes bacterium]|nr:MAG: hypothetical protein F9K23_07785 [Bacteroidota bacterium]
MKQFIFLLLLYSFLSCSSSLKERSKMDEVNVVVYFYKIDVYHDSYEKNINIQINGLSRLNGTLFFLKNQDSIMTYDASSINKAEILDSNLSKSFDQLTLEGLERINAAGGDYGIHKCGVTRNELIFRFINKKNGVLIKEFSIPEPLGCDTKDSCLKAIMNITDYLRSKL